MPPSAWRGLSSFLHDLLPIARQVPPHSDVRQRAVLVAVQKFGVEFVREQPTYINVATLATLAVLMSDRLRVHELRAPVPQTIAETDLHELPSEPPALMRSPFLLEVRDPSKESIFDGPVAWPEWRHTASLGGYELNGRWYLIGFGWPDGAVVSTWTPRWGTSLDDAQLTTSVMGDLDGGGYYDWGQDAVRTVVVLGLLLEAEHTPLAWSDDAPRPFSRTVNGQHQPARPWSVRRIWLDGEARRHGTSAAPGSSAVEGRAAQVVPVRGHLRRQPHGPGNTLRKWVYVTGFEARRWVAPRPLRVVVGQRGKG